MSNNKQVSVLLGYFHGLLPIPPKVHGRRKQKDDASQWGNEFPVTKLLSSSPNSFQFAITLFFKSSITF